MKRPLIVLGVTVILLIACAQTTPTIRPTNTATATPIAPTLTPLPTISPTPTPIVPTWSPYRPDDATGWCWQQVVGHVKHLNDVSFWDARTGWAVGERGAILHTSDGGATWQWQNGPVTATLQHVDFVSPQTGWILGTRFHSGRSDAILLKTDDGGATWFEQPIPPYDSHTSPTNMTWPNAHTGWLTIGTEVFRTNDGGQTWQELALPGRVYVRNTMISVDSQHAWIATDYADTIVRTDDGGATWTTYQITSTLLTGKFFLDDLAFVDARNGWATSRDAIIRTTDGGQTWEVQLSFKREDWDYMEQIDFQDAQTGLGWNSKGSLWRTTDGGATWEKHAIPRNRRAVAFVDEQNIWAVGSWSEKERSTIAHTVDGGVTWEMQDTHIETPELAYVAAARLTAYVSQRDAPWEGLLPLLFPGPCKFQDYGWLLNALHNLGWIEDTRWEAPLLPTDAGYLDMSDIFQHMDVDVDADGEDELVILGSSDIEMVAAVLDWDGTQWQVAWELRPFTRYDSDIRARVDDFDADGHLELLVEMLRHLGTGTGVLTQQWDVYLVRCTHLDCKIVWTDDIEYIGRAFSGLYLSYYWRGSDYRFTKPDGVTPGIVVQTYGVDFRQTPITTDTVTSTLTVLTSTQSIYLWDGAVYTPTGSTILTPAYTLDMDPITTTLSDGAYAVQEWEANPDGLWQTLSIYDGDASAPTQVFIAAFTGTPGAGVWLQDIDGDGQFEVKDCDTGFDLDVTLQFTERTSVLPECTIYQWDPSTRKFRP